MTPPAADQVARPAESRPLDPAILRIIEALARADVDRDYAAAQEAAHDCSRSLPRP